MQNLLWHGFETRASQMYTRLLINIQHGFHCELQSAYYAAIMNTVSTAQLHASNGQTIMVFLY